MNDFATSIGRAKRIRIIAKIFDSSEGVADGTMRILFEAVGFELVRSRSSTPALTCANMRLANGLVANGHGNRLEKLYKQLLFHARAVFARKSLRDKEPKRSNRRRPALRQRVPGAQPSTHFTLAGGGYAPMLQRSQTAATNACAQHAGTETSTNVKIQGRDFRV